MIGVIGATGNIGTHLITELSSRSANFVALSSKEQTTQKGQWRKCDLWSEESLLSALKGCDTVFYMIPLRPSWENFYTEIESSIRIFNRVADKLKFKKVVALSSLGAHRSEPIGMFHMARLIERELSNKNFKITFIRPAEFMENWKHSVAPVQYEGVLPNFHLPDSQPFHQVSVRDMARTVAKSLLGELDEKIIHVVGPHSYSAQDVKKAFEQKFSKPVMLVTPPRDTWVAEFQKYGMSKSYAQELVGLYDAIQGGLIQIDERNGMTIRGTSTIEDVVKIF